MFPIDSNDAYRNSDGSLTTIGTKIGSGGGGGSDIPDYSISDAGKVLTVGDDGELEWNEKGAGGGIYDNILRPILLLPNASSIQAQVAAIAKPVNSSFNVSLSNTATSTLYNIRDLLNFGFLNYVELYSPFTDALIGELDAVVLFDETSSASEITLNDDFTDYEFIAVQGMYNTDYTSEYNTTVIYKNPELNTPYWFGMKDRNSSYSGTVTFTDGTHATLSKSKRVRILGFNK